eukprot:TRINITY_DN4695_c0_g1_i1.p1 TRINITY_DN4695_c0_g1~~TRINITY_DN4695_c0_g1_i1.p1  ORF type:complete len:175 (+),score=26.44 TRINITY_DN4695_c0_g1_i1:263-787(+)
MAFKKLRAFAVIAVYLAAMKAMYAKNRDALLRLCVFEEPDISFRDLKAVWCDCDAQERFNELVDYGFLSVSKKETVRIHQLVLNSIKKRAGMVFQSQSMVRFAYAKNTHSIYLSTVVPLVAYHLASFGNCVRSGFDAVCIYTKDDQSIFFGRRRERHPAAHGTASLALQQHLPH